MAETQLVQIHTNLGKLLKSKYKALPKGFNETRFLQNAMTVLKDTKDIDKMDAHSVARTMLKGAFLGLDFFQKECYAIPYGNQLTFQTDYKGELKLAKKYSLKKIADIYAKLVRVGDTFLEYVDHGKQYIDFKPKSFNNDKIVGVFAVCRYEDGSMIYETMTKEEIEKVRDVYSKVPTGKAWKESFGEMAKKTCLRRLTKLIEYEFDSIDAQEAYKDSADFDFADEIEVREPVAMPEPIEEPEEERPKNGKKITLGQIRRLYAIGNKHGLDKEHIEVFIGDYGYSRVSEIRMDDYEKIVNEIESTESEEPKEEQTQIV